MAGALDVAGASPRRFFFEVLRDSAADPVEADRLAYFASPDGREALAQYNQREGRCPDHQTRMWTGCSLQRMQPLAEWECRSHCEGCPMPSPACSQL